jgi:predicted nucleic acid-binding protein
MLKVVSDSGPMIALASIGQLDLLHRLFGEIVVPPAVRAEVLDETSTTALSAAEWIKLQPPQDNLAVQFLRDDFGAGESEAIVLAKEIGADWILLDDLMARRKAQAIGLNMVGTLGLLLMAKASGYISAIMPLVDHLRRNGFRMSADLYTRILQQAVE